YGRRGPSSFRRGPRSGGVGGIGLGLGVLGLLASLAQAQQGGDDIALFGLEVRHAHHARGVTPSDARASAASLAERHARLCRQIGSGHGKRPSTARPVLRWGGSLVGAALIG